MKRTIKSIGLLTLSAAVFTSCVKTPEAGFTADKTTVAPGEYVAVTDNEELRKNVVYYYDMGDGTTYNERNPSHAYYNAGTYKVQQTLTATKNTEKKAGKSVSSSIDITVVGPTAGFTTAKTTYNVGEYINFENTTTLQSEYGYQPSYVWYYQTGSSSRQWFSSDKNPNWQSTTSGDYEITLEVSQGGARASFSANITIGGQDMTNAELQGKLSGKWSTIAVTSTHSGAGYTNNTTPCWGPGNTPIVKNNYTEVTLNSGGSASLAVLNDANAQTVTWGPSVSIMNGTYANLYGWVTYADSNASYLIPGSDWDGMYSYTMTDNSITFTRTTKQGASGSCETNNTFTITLTR
jgi:plastocyanin